MSASSEDRVFNPDDNLFHRNNIPLRLWCTGIFQGFAEGVGLAELLQDTGTVLDINVTFSEPLLLTHIITSGFSNGYVKNFTITWSLDEEEQLLPYNHSSETPDFVAAHIDTVFALNPPLAARRIRFNILDGLMTPTGQLCWHLTLLGCTLPEGMQHQRSVARTNWGWGWG